MAQNTRSPIARRLSLLVTLALVWLAARGSVPGYTDVPPLDLKRFELEIGGRITDVSWEDLNGDKRLDLLIIRGREIQVFFQSEQGFSSQAQQKWKFDSRAVLFDTIDFKGDGKRSILYLAADGVYSYDLVGARYRLLRKRRKKLVTLTRRPSGNEIRRKDLCRDFNADGLEDLVIPEGTGLGLYYNLSKGQKKVKLSERCPIFSPPSAAVDPGKDQLSSKTRAVYWFSNPSIVDFNKDGQRDLLLPVDDTLKIFPQGKDGRFPQYPSKSVKVPNQKLLQAGQRPDFDLDLTMPLMLKDLNNDGYVDLLSTHIGDGLTRVFMGGEDGDKAFTSPTQTIRAKGVSFFAFTIDLDGDGLLDLVIPRTDKIGIWYLLKVLVTRTVKIDALCFYQRPNKNRPFPTEPDFTKEIEIPLVFKSTGDKFNVGTTFVATVSGDLNGDGLKDVIYRTEAGKLSVFYGRKDRKEAFLDDPSAEIKIKSVENYRFLMAEVPDLNNDGRADVVLKYYSWDRKADRLSIFLSK